jgi:topoisomerase-4 subunit A
MEDNMDLNPDYQEDLNHEENGPLEQEDAFRRVHLSGMYKNWFLDYASYVILERAVPDVTDGLKPVQRRILHAMKQLDDGRFNKVANIIGHTMQYHPHGDASIGDALVQLGQKDLLVETQGNWGNILTGDSSAAPRYIEARLSKFALDVLFNPKTTAWKLSYDGRNKEPVDLPAKFPLLLAQGVEGIAVGLSSKILPHNFIELIDASVRILKGEDFEIFPDFPSGGLIDVSKYSHGARGGKVRVRAKIRKLDNKTLVISELPYGVTTGNLIESIIQANDKKKIKVRKIDDNTASEAEIVISLQQGVSPDQSIDALYAFTACEVSISPNACVISDGRPVFMDVKEILNISTKNTLDLLKKELEIRLDELNEQWQQASLEKIFIEKRIYRKIENCETWESVIETIQAGLKPHIKGLKREVTRDDIIKLTEIRIKRISKYDASKADNFIKEIESGIEETENHLANLVNYAISWYRQIKKKYAAGRERKTEIRNFDNIEATLVAVANQKLYINREEGFAGSGLKKDEFVCDCSDIDDIIVFREDGSFFVTKVENKFFVGKNVIHIDVFKKNDDRTIYNMIYRDGKKGACLAKRFAVIGITRDKEYDLTKGAGGSRVLYFSANPNGEAETVRIMLRPRPKMKKNYLEFDFSELAIKGRNANGNIVTKKPVTKIQIKDEGVSTLKAREIWFDESVKRLNADERGAYLGAFEGADRILTIHQSGYYRLYGYDLSTHFEDDMIFIMKFDPGRVISVIYFDGNTGKYYLKRFQVEVTDKPVGFLSDHPESRLVEISLDWQPRIEVSFKEHQGKKREEETIEVAGFIAVKSWKAKGKRITDHEVKDIRWLEPLPGGEPEPPTAEQENVDKAEDDDVLPDIQPDNDAGNGDGADDSNENGNGKESDGAEGNDPTGQQIRLDF